MLKLVKVFLTVILIVLTGSLGFAQEELSGTVTLWGWSYESMEATGLIDAFKEEHPNVNIEIVVYPSGDTYQNLQLACSAGQGAPDVVQLENSHLAGFVALDGCLTDITENVEPLLEDFNDYK
jgi:ABC-type glycerol-3-phosphate transport system substrate-binding protein